MVESNIEKLANKLQLFWFITDSLNNGEDISQDILEKATNSLDEIKQLLFDSEKEIQSWKK